MKLVKKLKSTISFEETSERFNKKKSKELTVNDLQHEIKTIKQEINELKHEFKSIKSDNNNLKQELIMLKIDKNLNKSDNKQDKQGEHKDGAELLRYQFLSGRLCVLTVFWDFH